MQAWKNELLQLARLADHHTGNWQHWLRKRLGAQHPLQLVAYRSYGTPRRVYVKGRVLENKNIAAGTESDSAITNVLNMYRRFNSNEVRGATVRITVQNESHTVTTDNEGYFVFQLHPDEPLFTPELYHELPLQLLDAPYAFAPLSTEAQIIIPPHDAEYGIISDIDDTVIKTGATNLLAMGKTVLLSNAKTRLPFPGVSELYKALQLGRNGKRNNPFFYVSSSPWNLYDLLIDFLDHNEIPPGPLLLRDFGIGSESFVSGDYLSHKFTEIAHILDTYPQLNFVLVGDSGEQDPPIYLEVVKRYPGRILAVYIRDVAEGEKKTAARQAAAQMQQLGVTMQLTKDSAEAAMHAAQTGLIFTKEIAAVVEDKKKDEGTAAGKQDLQP